MLLIEEVKMLRECLLKIKNIPVVTPLAGGSVDSAYELIKYMALARNIFEKIEKCKDNKFSITGKKFENKAQNGKEPIKIKDVFNRIIHGSYIHKSEENLHVINDWGDEYIISAEEFMNVLDSLCLKDHEVAFVVCKTLRDRIQELCGVYEKEGSSDKFRAMLEKKGIMSGVTRGPLFWLVHTYCSTGDLVDKVTEKFFVEQSDNILLFFWCSNVHYNGDFSTYLEFGLGSRWRQENDEVVETRTINLYDLLSLVEKYTERVSENLSR